MCWPRSMYGNVILSRIIRKLLTYTHQVLQVHDHVINLVYRLHTYANHFRVVSKTFSRRDIVVPGEDKVFAVGILFPL